MLRKVKDKYQQFYGIDISPSRLGEAKEITKDLYPYDISKSKFIEENADKPLPFPDNYFNTIICVAVIERVYDIFSLVREMHRVLKPDDHVIAEVPNVAYFKHRISLLFGKLPATSSPCNWQNVGWDGGYIHYFTMNKFYWLFKSQGFQIIKRNRNGFLAKFGNWNSPFLTGDLFIKVKSLK